MKNSIIISVIAFILNFTVLSAQVKKDSIVPKPKKEKYYLENWLFTSNYSNSFNPGAGSGGIGYHLWITRRLYYGNAWYLDGALNFGKDRIEPVFMASALNQEWNWPFAFGGEFKPVYQTWEQPRYYVGPTLRIIEAGLFTIQYAFLVDLTGDKISYQANEIRILIRPAYLPLMFNDSYDMGTKRGYKRHGYKTYP